MKKNVLFIFLCIVSMISYGQSYSSNFQSAQQIRQYLAANIDKLDPVEGEYDEQETVNFTTVKMDFNLNLSRVWDSADFNRILFIVKNPTWDEFTVYCLDGNRFYKAIHLKVESIGTTNAYRLYWDGSSNRMILENNIRLSTTIELSSTDAKTHAGNSQYQGRVIIEYDMVKKYPTGEMYAEAARKAAEERAKAEIPQDWSGTGFALNNGYIVTNHHVIENAKTIKVQGVGGNFSVKYNASVVASDKNNDLALLKISDSRFSGFGAIPYKVNTTTTEVGEEIFVLGYPLTSTMGDEIKLTTGVISSKSGFQGDVSLYQISAPVQPGNSGGPLFDSRGNVIGIVSAKHLGAENVGYAIKASYLRNLVESVASTNVLPQTNRVTSPNLSGKVKAVKNYVYFIDCTR